MSKGTLPSRSAAEHHEAGIALASERRFAEAVKEYLEAARLNPNVPETFYNLGVAYGELGQLKAAIKAYNRAIHLDPKDWQAYCNRAFGLLNLYLERVQPMLAAVAISALSSTLGVSESLPLTSARADAACIRGIGRRWRSWSSSPNVHLMIVSTRWKTT